MDCEVCSKKIKKEASWIISHEVIFQCLEILYIQYEFLKNIILITIIVIRQSTYICTSRQNYSVKNIIINRHTTFPSNHNFHKSFCRLCFWAPDPLIDFSNIYQSNGPGAQKQRPLKSL